MYIVFMIYLIICVTGLWFNYNVKIRLNELFDTTFYTIDLSDILMIIPIYQFKPMIGAIGVMMVDDEEIKKWVEEIKKE